MEHRYRWVIVAVGAVMGCVTIGTMFALAVFLEPMASDTGWSRAGISSAMTLGFLAMGLGGFLSGAASDRFGTRVVVLAGSLLMGLAPVLASRSATLAGFQLTYGVMLGFAASAFLAPMMSATTAWFTRNRALAVSLVSAGMGMAPLTISPLARWLISATDWRTAMLWIGVLAWTLLVPAGLLVRRPPAVVAAAGPGTATADQGPRPSFGRAVRSPQFLVLGLTFFACCAAHSGPIFHMVSYAILCGVGPMAAVSIYSLQGLAGLAGRILLGVLADRYGATRVLACGLLVQALAIGGYVFVSELEEFYALAVVFGGAYGGVMPLYAVLAREYFGQAIMGRVFGAITMLSSIGMALGPLAGGFVFDALGDYAWLFIGSMAVGFGAVGVALAFPPPSRSRFRTA